jgi:4-amino-4-deoxy-L-arabinose transferase-like glycosyltransferase
VKLVERSEDAGGWAGRLSRPRWALAGLGLLALVCFAPSLRSGFVYDDQWTIVHNSSIRSFARFSDLWTGKAMREGVADAWRPLMVLSQMLDYRVFGLRPPGHHLHSLLWHLACVLLLYGLCLRVFGARDLALGCAALFAVHPLHVEPVAAINYREDLISSALGLAALLVLWPRGPADRRPRPRALLGGAALLLGGLLAKESVAVLPLVYLGLRLALPGPESFRVRLRSAAPATAALLAAVAAHLAWRWVTTGSVDPYPALGSTIPMAGQSFLVRFPTHAEALAKSTAQALLPLGLGPEYPFVQRSWASAAGLGSVAVVVALTTSTGWLLWRQRGLLSCALLIWLLGWLPYSGLLPLPNLRADRYAYLPAWGICLLWAGALLRLPGAELRRWAVTLLLGLFLVLTIRQQNIWRSELHLWSAATRSAPASVRARGSGAFGAGPMARAMQLGK